jgi:hypothetical protein
MAYNPANVVSYGFPIDVTIFTYLLATAVSAADVGKAVSQDTAAANRVKLAADAEHVFGRLETYEDRDMLSIKTGAVSRLFKEKLPAANGHGIVVGDRVVGAGAGLVRKANTAVPAEVTNNRTIVVETGTTYVVVERI